MSEQTVTSFSSTSTNAETIAHALGGKKCGQGWKARCPAHDDQDPSLSINEKNGKVLVRCFSGCSQDAVLDALRQRRLWPDKSQAGVSQARKPHSTHAASPPAVRSPQPQTLWAGYSPASPSHLYLAKKRIHVHDARVDPQKNSLVIPLQDTACNISPPPARKSS